VKERTPQHDELGVALEVRNDVSARAVRR
jgi:hypothetical protein